MSENTRDKNKFPRRRPLVIETSSSGSLGKSASQAGNNQNLTLENEQYNTRGPVYHETMAYLDCKTLPTVSETIAIGASTIGMENLSIDVSSSSENQIFEATKLEHSVNEPRSGDSDNLSLGMGNVSVILAKVKTLHLVPSSLQPDHLHDLDDELDPRDELEFEQLKFLSNRAKDYYMRDKWKMAEVSVKEIIKILQRKTGQEYNDIRRHWIWALVEIEADQNKWSDALSTLESLVDTGFNSDPYGQPGRLLHTKAYLHFRLGNLNTARQICQKAVETRLESYENQACSSETLDRSMELLELIHVELKENTPSRTETPEYSDVDQYRGFPAQRFFISKWDIDIDTKGNIIAKPEPMLRAIDCAISSDSENLALATILFREGRLLPLNDGIGYQTPLIWALKIGHIRMIEYLLKNEIVKPPEYYSEYALSCVLSHATDKFIEIMNKLFECGFSVDGPDRNLLLQYAWIYNYETTGNLKMRYLLERGAQTERRDASGRTPLNLAAYQISNLTTHDVWEKEQLRSLCSMVRELLAAGADPNAADYMGNTALHHLATASQQDHETAHFWDLKSEVYALDDIVKLLVQDNANPMVKNTFGQRPYTIAKFGVKRILREAEKKALRYTRTG